MDTLFIQGGRPLTGEVSISGSKNAVLPILASTVLFSEPCLIRNCPYLSDVDAALNILTYLGARVCREGRDIYVDPRRIYRWRIPSAMMGAMRGSVFFAGPLIARLGKCCLMQPGGCVLGNRPVDYHMAGLLKLGAMQCDEDFPVFSGPLRGATIELAYPSVGATENLIMAALGAEGDTWIFNAAREPEIVNLCDFLRSGGCRISGDGSNQILISGGLPHAGEGTVIPDRMEAATFACAAASAGGSISLYNVRTDDLEAVLAVLIRAGCLIRKTGYGFDMESGELISPGLITTGPYPSFPTDAQAPVMGALLRAKGITLINETVFSDRFNHIPGMVCLGADISRYANHARICGVDRLRGGCVTATDLRAGAGLAVAALAATGTTQLHGLHYLMRGYDDFAGKLSVLGAKVETA